MDRPYVEWVRIEGYGCVRNTDIQLTPLHALIGPNDSGKSTILRAIESRGQRAAESRAAATYWLSSSDAAWSEQRGLGIGPYPQFELSTVEDPTNKRIRAALSSRLLRLDPDELRQPHPLIPKLEKIWFKNVRGLGLGSMYDALLGTNRAAFIAIEDRFRGLFPTVQALRLENADQNTKTLALTLVDGTEVGAREMSEGMLYWLAFAIVPHLVSTGILLIEEPENGLHPSRIAEVMRVLREVSEKTQVIVATHSPLVINELKPDEVTLVTRTPAEGTLCTPLAKTKHFAERSKVYALGELWLSYADGELERELVAPPDTTAKAG